MKRLLTLVLLMAFVACQQEAPQINVSKGQLASKTISDYPSTLSAWGFFEEPLSNLKAKKELIPYDLISPLFSDYAQKTRFIKVPKDSVINYQETEILDFPIGTVLIKNFHYSEAQLGEARIIETRLLVHESDAWKALSYVWNEEQNEAFRSLSGASIPLELNGKKGQKIAFNYSVPNEVQCKSCHEYQGKMSPIGPKARQLNHKFAYGFKYENQLAHWEELGLLQGLPAVDKVPNMVNYFELREDLDLRARAYLDINCAHCHRREGPAKNSGLYLTYQEQDAYKIGWNKPPVAAGRGSGGMQYALVAGEPEKSILYHRMASLDPGVMMPELGRKLNHEQGLDLIYQWIKSKKQHE